MTFKDLCLPGSYYTTNGCYQCPALPLLSLYWSQARDQKRCLDTFSIPAPGTQEAYIPIGVSKMKLMLPESESQNLDYLAVNGRDGGRVSCILSVPMNQTVYVVVTIQNDSNMYSNSDDEGFGSAFHKNSLEQKGAALTKRDAAGPYADEVCEIGPYTASIGTQIHLTKESQLVKKNLIA